MRCLGRNVDYTMVWNSLDSVACVVPVTKVDISRDVATQREGTFYSDIDKRHFESCKIRYLVSYLFV